MSDATTTIAHSRIRRMAQRVRTLALLQPLAGRNFRLLWLGEGVSLLGDQFFFVALTWLTLQLTESGLALGTVLTAAAIPRAVFMLVGGALSDRFSPRTIMLVSNAVRAVLVAVLTGLILLDSIQLWHLYLLVVVFGLVDAFFYPAFRTILPMLVDEDRLEAGNALVQGTARLSVLIGPALAGILVSVVGLGAAFGIDAVTFVFATLMLWLMKGGNGQLQKEAVTTDSTKPGGLVSAIHEGLRYAWSDPVIRAILFLFAAIDFSAVGPFNVGVPWLAHNRFVGGATALGMMLSAWGGGALVGVLVGGSIRLRRRGVMLVGVAGGVGIGLALLGFVPNVVAASVIIGAMGLGSGLINVVMVAWLQTRTDPRMLGRVMSLVMFSSFGVAPLSLALAGALVDLHATIMFAAAGAIVLIATAYSAANRTVRTIG